jgi:DNA-binding transcriptional MerR regulator
MPKSKNQKERTVALPSPEGEKPCTISALARMVGLSRTTLLYYDRIGLLRPSGRTRAGYRLYTQTDRRRLERICGFREAGLALQDIRAIMATEGKPSTLVLERRFHEISREILALKAKQGLLSRMLAGMASTEGLPAVDRKLWVEMLRAAGMDNKAMALWHAEFEQRAPKAHHDFLLSLGIPEKEALRIREWSRKSSRIKPR